MLQCLPRILACVASWSLVYRNLPGANVKIGIGADWADRALLPVVVHIDHWGCYGDDQNDIMNVATSRCEQSICSDIDFSYEGVVLKQAKE